MIGKTYHLTDLEIKMEEVRKLLKQAFDLALQNDIALRSVKFDFIEHRILDRDPISERAELRSVDIDCKMFSKEAQPV